MAHWTSISESEFPWERDALAFIAEDGKAAPDLDRLPFDDPAVYRMIAAGDTDGVDGQEEIAGAYLAPDSLARAWSKGIRPKDALVNNDGHGFFEALGDSLVTGPTLTNVNDFRAILIVQ